MKAPFLIGRILFGGYFLYSGINHLTQRKDMASYTAGKVFRSPNSQLRLPPSRSSPEVRACSSA